MKKSLFTTLVIALFSGITMAQGVCPTAATATATVTFKRISTTPTFSVSSTTKVQFSTGNLQYIKSSNQWGFMDQQYSMAEIDETSNIIGYDYANQDIVGLFGWATSGNAASGASYQPYSTSISNYDYGNLSQASSGEWDSAKSDWGQNIPPSGYWRTLTSAEWAYLMNTRTPDVTVNGTSHARWTHAKILTDGSGTEGVSYNICGLILFPDNYAGGTPAGVNWSYINSGTDFATTCTTAGWTALEAAGCVFLPCAGRRSGISLHEHASQGNYWSSTATDGAHASAFHFVSGNCSVAALDRLFGFSVRLVHVVE